MIRGDNGPLGGYFFYSGMEMLEAAKALKILHETFIEAGFTDDQAMDLVKTFITNAQNNNNNDNGGNKNVKQ